MNDEAFIDTNISVYAHLESPADNRWQVARELTESRTGFTVSTQVLNEYYAAMLKNRRPDVLVQENIEEMIREITGSE